MGWIVVAVRGRRASLLTRAIHESREEAEAFMAEQQTVDTMFNDETPEIVLLELPYRPPTVKRNRWWG